MRTVKYKPQTKFRYRKDGFGFKEPRSQVALVPNNEEGWYFIHMLRKHLSPDKKIVLKGRGPRKGTKTYYGQVIYNGDIAPKDGIEIGIYIYNKERV